MNYLKRPLMTVAALTTLTASATYANGRIDLTDLGVGMAGSRASTATLSTAIAGDVTLIPTNGALFFEGHDGPGDISGDTLGFSLSLDGVGVGNDEITGTSQAFVFSMSENSGRDDRSADAAVADITVVPLPAAVWLFGSVLAGMAGIGYRMSGAA